MAPEVLQGQPASPGSDLFMLGVTAYKLLTGNTTKSTVEDIPKNLAKVSILAVIPHI